jgi:putative transport protein
VGTTKGLDQFQRVVGELSDENLFSEAGTVTFRQIVVTSKDVLGKSIGELIPNLQSGLVVTRVARGDLELAAVPTVKVQFGDVLTVVGPGDGIDKAAVQLGNSLHALNETHFIPFFLGISAGIALGTLPIPIPGLPQPLKLGLAGGPLLVAILVGRLGHLGRLVWHMPRNANLAFREFGIALFFASVGLLAGPTFFVTVCSTTGLLWLFAGVCVTVLPLLIVATVARSAYAMNYVELAGLLSGSMTDPPALAFASAICKSEAPAISYAAVYPLTMLLRIMAAQILAVALVG